MPSAKDINRDYYNTPSPGRADYWHRMAAPRFRMATFLRILREDPPASLVDLGCGSGEMLTEIKQRLPLIRLCGIDFSAAQVEANRARHPSIDWRKFDLEGKDAIHRDLAGNFDVIVASEIIEHLSHPELFLQNAHSLAKTGKGRILLSTQSGKIQETERRVGHLRHYSKEEMQRILISAGWKPTWIWNEGFPFHDWSKLFANINPDATMSRFSDGQYGWTEKMICLILRMAFRFNSRSKGTQLFVLAQTK